mmetsp:Transcript_1937/g.3079  ORF Transcript_1937/g.3079 Transcript_1937/m.3079 type:complete len:155 (+) Transcript_1937:49-513(+)|eukprot:CAMPEP_0185020578 /NCGR_PEP_ID=MMETSP1103-20130426/3196_1 /TAXON_ID=36769 /ORGANISM="Paraphysomonas bandaiensis, Strain Caron Lab Isolate" /LENGTH=154 /DNA_ID=CAMNT_0027551571 /DNA_START=49 /DNA_END=513 /DNA_ORIENTATION=-
MAIGWYERCTGYNWQRAADISGQVATVCCIGFAIINWIFKYNIGIGVYTFFIGLIMTIWEMPFLYACIGPCTKLYQAFQEKLYFKKPIVRTILYIGLSIVTFIRETPCIGAGMLLLVAAIFNVLAQMNQISDAADEEAASRRSSNKASLVGNTV